MWGIRASANLDRLQLFSFISDSASVDDHVNPNCQEHLLVVFNSFIYLDWNVSVLTR